MIDKEVILLDKKTKLDDLRGLIQKKSNNQESLDIVLINENKINVIIYKIIPLAVLKIFECNKSIGFSKREIFLQIYKEISVLFTKLDPYKKKGIWGIFFDELQINHILFYPSLKKMNVSIS